MSDHFFDDTFEAFLFDMDGTILNSIAAAERVWGAWFRKIGLDPEVYLPTIHGRKVSETIASLSLSHIDPEAEASAITKAEIAEVEGVVPIPGASLFLNSLPPRKWAVVTSAPLALARTRLEAAGLPTPAILVTAEDVQKGKPAPDCFVLAAERLAVNPVRCLAFEDAEAGIAAAVSAGCTVMVVTETHKHDFDGSHNQIKNYQHVRPEILRGGLGLTRI